MIEVQLRTFRQDAWANQIEEDGRTQLTALKFGEGDRHLHDYYRAVSSAFAALDRGEPLGGKIEDDLVETFRKVRPILGR
jgi:ppGpp synthetase/RelA/SpoT-type nucleotidyltranferase